MYQSAALSSSSTENCSEKEQKVQDPKVEKIVAPLERFRSLARSVQSQGRWTKALQSKIAEEHSKEFKISQQSGGLTEILSFNVSGKKFLSLFVTLWLYSFKRE